MKKIKRSKFLAKEWLEDTIKKFQELQEDTEMVIAGNTLLMAQAEYDIAETRKEHGAITTVIWELERMLEERMYERK